MLTQTNDIDDNLSRQIFDPAGRDRGQVYEAVRVFHDRYKVNKGIHIYFGGGERSTVSGKTIEIPLAQLQQWQSNDNFILMSWYFDRYMISHEIGHFLGLYHVNGSLDDLNLDSYVNCNHGTPINEFIYGGLLMDGGEINENLMNVCALRYKLTPSQIDRIRGIACQYLRFWELPAPCTP